MQAVEVKTGCISIKQSKITINNKFVIKRLEQGSINVTNFNKITPGE